MSKPEVRLDFNENDGTYLYPMDNPNRGYFVIFNQIEFDANHLKERKGTENDVKELIEAADSLGFVSESILRYDNKTKAEIEAELKYLSSTADHSNNDCFVCVILTHGDTNDILHSKDEKLKLTDFTEKFNADKCKSLAGKPKLFFIQACRGSETVDGQDVILITEMKKENRISSDGPDKKKSTPLLNKIITVDTTIPVASDFLIAHATIPVCQSWRDGMTGSYFIQRLTSVFKQFGEKLELMEMMTLVNKKVSEFEIYEIISPKDGRLPEPEDQYVGEEGLNKYKDYEKKLIKQIPSVVTQLIGKVYFGPKKSIFFEQQESEKSRNKPGDEAEVKSLS